MLALIWQSKKNYERAISGYEQIIKEHPDFISAYLELGSLLVRLSKPEEAIAIYEKALHHNPAEKRFAETIKKLQIKEENANLEQVIIHDNRSTIQKNDEEPIKILFYTDCPGIGGAEQINHLIMCGLAAHGYNITCAQPIASNSFIDERRNLGIDHFWIIEDDIYDLPKYHPSLDDSTEALGIFNKVKPDLIIFGNGIPVSNLAAMTAALELSIPYVTIIHLASFEISADYKRYSQMLKNVLLNAHDIVSVSYENLEVLHNQFGLPENKGVVIYNGRPDQFFIKKDLAKKKQLCKELGINQSTTLALTVASMEMRKGYQHQLKAIHTLRDIKIWKDLHFIWVGIGPAEPKLRVWISQVGVNSHVHFLGERSDVTDILDAVDVFILTSHSEGMPMVVLEAMAKGVPIIATAVSGIPEALGDTGKLLPDPRINPEKTVEELINTLSGWVLNPEQLRAEGDRCRVRAEKLFRSERMIMEYLSLVENELVLLKK